MPETSLLDSLELKSREATRLIHDLNNALAPVMLGLEIVGDQLPKEVKESARWKSVQHNVNRAGKLAREIQRVARAVRDAKPLPLRILLVDDEERMRTAGRALLASLGCESVAAESGEAALNTFQKDPYIFDIALVDLQMPERNGIQTIEELRKVRANLRVILASGAPPDPTTLPLNTVCLGKPFSRTHLQASLHSALAIP